MKYSIKTLSLIAVLSGLTAGANAQNTIVWHDDFDQQTSGVNSTDGTYGRIAYNFGGSAGANPIVLITNATNPDTLTGDPSYTHTNYCAFIFDSTALTSGAYNYGWDINSIAAAGNTNSSLRAYILKFDIAVQGDGMNNLGGYVGPILYVFGHNAAGTWSSGEYYGNGAQTNFGASWFPSPGSGWVHVEMPLASFGTANASLLSPTDAAFSFGIGAYMAGLTAVGQEEIDIANLEIEMTNPPVLPPPAMTILPAKPGLRIFAQDSTAPWNQEGFGTVDLNQSWVGVATPANPVSYSITIGDFDTVDNYTLYAQFLQNGDPGNPYGVYAGANALVWSITHQASGFTTAINWKTNAPTGGTPNNALSLTTTSTNGRGTWTMTFSSDTNGTVTAPDGSSAAFVLPSDPDWTADFANPLIIDFGTAPNNANGYGQFIDLNGLAITNVVDGNIYDDFTQDDTLNTSLWNPGFSLNAAKANNAGSVFLISTNTSYWVYWSLPDDNFGLGTKASLNGGTNVWFTPNYYGNSVVTNTTPTVMGGTLKWTLIPAGCLPTVDGTQGGTPATSAFFQLANPAPSQ